MKVCMVTTRHLPGDPRIFEKEAKSLRKMGLDVSIVVPEGNLPPDSAGISFLTFRKAPRPLRKISTFWRTLKLSLMTKADIYHCHEPDVSLLVGVLIKLIERKKPVKIIFDAHEFWLGFFAERMPWGFRNLTKLLYLIYERIILSFVDFIITANSIEKNYYQIIFPLKDIQILYNTPPVNSSADGSGAKRYKKEFDLCFEGFLNFERGLKEMFYVVERLKKKFHNITLLILGDFVDNRAREWAEKFINDHGLQNNIILTGWQPYHRLFSFHQKSKIGLFLYHYTPTHLLSGPPNKLFNFMKAGIPIIASKLPETINILEEVGCGFLVNPIDIDDVAQKVSIILTDEKLREEMGSRGNVAFRTRYNWLIEEQKLFTIYKRLTG